MSVLENNSIIDKTKYLINNQNYKKMKTKLLLTLFSLSLLISCNNTTTKEEKTDEQTQTASDGSWSSLFEKIDIKDIPDNMIQLISDDWMLVTAGDQKSFNTMTASWGGMGYIWGKPASFIFIRNTRYTYEFLQKEDSFTLTFFPEENRGALKILGNRSGRDTDKVKDSGLTPIATPSGLETFAEAKLVIECKKMYVDELNSDFLTNQYKSDITSKYYEGGETAPHTLFISEITNVWVKK